MEIDVKKEPVSFSRKKSETNISTTVENDIIIPDVKEDIKSVVNADTYVKITDFDMQNDRILLNGDVTANIMYLTDTAEPCLRSVKTTFKFTDVAELKGTGENTKQSVECYIKSAEFNVLNGRKLNIKCCVNSVVKIFEKTEILAIAEVLNVKGFENITEKISLCDLNAPFKREIELSEKLAFPLSEEGAKEILRVYGNISDKNAKIINGKVIVKGEVVLNSIYEGVLSGEIKTSASTVGFTEIFDVDGISTDTPSDINFDISYIDFMPFENSEGEIRGADTKVGLSLNINYYQDKTYEVIKDCYCLTQKANVKTNDIEIMSSKTDVDKQLTVKDTISVSESAPKIKQILDVDSKGYITGVEDDGDNVTVKGSIDSYLVYMSEDINSPLYSAYKTTEFSENFLKPKGKTIDSVISINTLGSSYSFVDETQAEIRCNIEVKGVITGIDKKSIISEIEFEELEEKSSQMPSFTVYFTQKGDKLWDVAKKYYTTVSGIKEMNNMETDELKEGTKLFIPRY